MTEPESERQARELLARQELMRRAQELNQKIQEQIRDDASGDTE